jgi:purine-binding chemotaxis protein CheW
MVDGPVPATPSRDAWLVCRVADRLLAIGLADVVETFRPLPLRAFSGVPGWVLGVSVIRGAVVPVIDMESLLGVRSADLPTAGRFVTIRLDGRTVALAVDEVLGVRALETATLHDVPRLLGALDEAALSAMGTLDSGLLLVLGGARLIPDAVWARLDEQENADRQGSLGSAARSAERVTQS